MNVLRRLLAVTALSSMLALAVYAGEMGTGYAPPPPTTNAAGEMGTGYSSSPTTSALGEMGTGATQTSSTSSIAEILLLIIQGLTPRI
ncbi:hypothetical protein [Pyrinomonas sp.]|uniref:hypothetical protein n=1 Tax=Pyrinomonas sp. TaxID=2080306 RepID=UPI00331EBC67